jgi:hypothetical protein
VVPLVALLIVAVAGLVLGLGRLGGDAVDRARARTAADAAALAGAAAGRDEAESVAEANGARLVAWETAGADVRVRVSFRGFEASARARRVASRVAGPPPGDSTLRVGDHHR